MMNREEKIEILEKENWDFIVIGGGASGLGIAVDAASRGFKTVLLEREDFSKGTSSRSTKLVHGGVRYLAQGNIGLVRQALRERGLLYKNARHLFKNQSFIIPAYGFGTGLFYWFGLKIYDLLSGRLSLGASRWIGKRKAISWLPLLKRERLTNGVVYRDGQFDDARLALNLAATAEEQGAITLNYLKVVELLKDDSGQVCGVVAEDGETKATYTIHGTCVVNATGVFSNKILKLDSKDPDSLRVAPSQGIHLVLDASFLQSDKALMIPKTTDGRVLFAIPWHGKVVVGTTDTAVKKAEYEPPPLEEEVDFILQNLSQYFTKQATRDDVLSVFAGLRPLVASKGDRQNTKEISRDHKIVVSKSKLISIIGGKWTTYRKMAEQLVDTAIETYGLQKLPSKTTRLSIHGNIGSQNRPTQDHLRTYGTDAEEIRALWQENVEYRQRLHPEYPYTVAEVIFGVRHEMARTVEDILARRIRLLFLDARAAAACADKVASILAEELKRDTTWEQEQVSSFKALSNKYLLTK